MTLPERQNDRGMVSYAPQNWWGVVPEVGTILFADWCHCDSGIFYAGQDGEVPVANGRLVVALWQNRTKLL